MVSSRSAPLRRRGRQSVAAGQLASAALLGGATLLLATPARAQIPSECVQAYCDCPDGRRGVPVPCGTPSCLDVCGLGSGSEPSGGSTEGGGGGLIDALANLLAPSEPDPAQIAAAEEAARLRAQELSDAKAEHATAAQARIERETLGQKLLAALEALERILAEAPREGVARALIGPLLSPLPARDRMPADAIAQARSAAFHGGLALAIGAWDDTVLPTIDTSFLDCERLAFEAGAPFDTGTAIAGSERYEVPVDFGAPGSPVVLPASNDPRQLAAQLRGVVPSMRAAAERVVAAEQGLATADANWRAASDQAAKDLERRAGALAVAAHDLAAQAAKIEALLAQKREAEATPQFRWDPAKREQHRELLESLAAQQRAGEAMQAELDEVKRQQLEEEQRQRAELEAQKLLLDRARQLVAEEQGRVQQGQQRLLAAQRQIRALAGAAMGAGFVRSGPGTGGGR